MNYIKNQEVKLRINDIGAEGEGIGRTGDGATFFVKGALPGELVTASVLKWKKSYGYARLISIDEKSPDRVEPKCPIADKCGGCTLQHLSYAKQLEWKQNKVLNCIARIGGFENVPMEQIRGMEEPFYYRNKAQFPVQRNSSGRVKLGFYAGHTHSVIETEHCYIQADIMNSLLGAVREYAEQNNVSAYDEETGKGLLRHILIRVGVNTKEVCLCPVVNGSKLPKWESLYTLASGICEKLKYNLTSFCVDYNTEDTNVILSDKVECLAGRSYIYDSIGDVTYRISPLSFYQVNPVQTKVIYDSVKEFAGLTGEEILWDIYCGTGTIGLYLAKNAKKLTGIEIVPEAIADAKQNAAYNHIENAEFYAGAAEAVLPKLVSGKASEKTVAIIDPPRKGCDSVLLDTLLTLSPDRIVYVSCDPATLARDLRILADGGYSLEKVRPVDAFCNTTHVESVTLLERN